MQNESTNKQVVNNPVVADPQSETKEVATNKPLSFDEEQKLKEEEEKLYMSKYPTVSYFTLQFKLATYKEIIFFCLSIFGAMGMGVCFPLFALIFGDTMNTFSNPAQSASGLSVNIGDLALKLVYIGLGQFGGTFLNIYFGVLCGEGMTKNFKSAYFKILMKQEQAFYDERNAFEFSTKVTAQIKTMKEGVGSKVGNAVMSICMFISAYIVGFIISWKLSLVLCSIVPFMIGGGYWMIKSLSEAQSQGRKYFEEAGGIAEEILYSIKTVASFANFEYEKERFSEKANSSYEKSKYGGIVSSIARAFVFFLIFGSYALAFGVGALFISRGETLGRNEGELFQVGHVITVIFTIVFGAFSLGQAAPNIKAISSACESSREFFYLLNRKQDMDFSQSIEKPHANSINGNIQFKNVTFKYPTKDRIILNNLNLDFETGKSTAIVGETGSGKSTIVNLLERLYDVNSGEVLVDGKNIKNFDIHYLRSLIGYVPQEPVLFNTSIRENIIFGRTDVTEEEINTACEMSFCNEFIGKLEKKLDTKVGLKGSKLSGGQKQRVAIARAILKKPKILILDEATSALDYRSEKIVKKALDLVSKNVTTIIIAHRLSTVRNANKIIVLSNGAIAETGTHDDLYKLNGLYYLLVKNQTSNEEEDAGNEGNFYFYFYFRRSSQKSK